MGVDAEGWMKTCFWETWAASSAPKEARRLISELGTSFSRLGLACPGAPETLNGSHSSSKHMGAEGAEIFQPLHSSVTTWQRVGWRL